MVRAALLLVDIGEAIVIVVEVCIVAYRVLIVVIPLARVAREIVDYIVPTIVIIVLIETIAFAITIEVRGVGIRVELIGHARPLVIV